MRNQSDRGGEGNRGSDRLTPENGGGAGKDSEASSVIRGKVYEGPPDQADKKTLIIMDTQTGDSYPLPRPLVDQYTERYGNPHRHVVDFKLDDSGKVIEMEKVS